MTRIVNTFARSGIALALLAVALGPASPAEPAGTLLDPVIDSKMTADEAFEGLDRRCPKELRERQKIVPVLYWGFDQKVHRGQIIVDQELEKDVAEVFAVALKEKFPIQSVIPVSLPKGTSKFCKHSPQLGVDGAYAVHAAVSGPAAQAVAAP